MPVAADVTEQFQDAVGAHEMDAAPFVLAVSGGSDSTALMHLAADVFPSDQIIVASVDHGLRTDAEVEIAQVAEQAGLLGLRHEVRRWNWDKQGNLQAAARNGRWRLLREVAERAGAGAVWMGHTQDDQVETALMRLARGSGVDGLTGMYPHSRRDSVWVFRPLLGIAREDLRAWLTQRGIGWSDDPSNADPRFDRVKARQMFTQLQSLGLTRKRLLQTIDHMQVAQAALVDGARSFAHAHVRQDAGDLVLSAQTLEVDRADAPRRVLAAAVGWMSGATYRPRWDRLRDAAERVKTGHTLTLGGVLWTPLTGGGARLSREVAAARRAVSPALPQPSSEGVIWDGRWYLEGPATAGQTIAALADGIVQVPDWRQTGLPRHTLQASPAIWQGDEIVAAPVAGMANGWMARIVADFHSTAFAIED